MKTEWRTMEIKPPRAMPVLLIATTAVWTDHRTGEPTDTAFDDPVRYDIGYWDGEEFYEAGTNHLVYEFGAKPGDTGWPDYWMPLPKPPEETS